MTRTAAGPGTGRKRDRQAPSLPGALEAPVHDRTFRLLADRGADVVYRVSMPGVVLEYVNGAVETLTGYTPDELYSDPGLWRRLVHPEDSALITADLGTSDAIRTPLMVRWIHRDGHVVWTEHRSVPVIDRHGTLVAVEGVARDMTRQVTAERSLRLSEARFRSLLSDIDLGTLILDADGRVVFINDHLLSLLVRTREELLGRAWLDVVPQRERETLAAIFAALIATGVPPPSREAGIVTPTGEERQLAWTTVVLRDDDGAVSGIASIAHDVTGTHRAHAERALLAAAMEQGADVVMITDPDANLVFINPAFEQETGYSRDEVLGMNPRMLSAGVEPAGTYAAMWTALLAGAAWHGELLNRRKDGTEYTDELTITPVFGAEGALSAYISVQRDISHIRKVEAELVLESRVRGLLAQAIAQAASTPSVEEAARSVCHGLASLPGIDIAHLILFLHDGSSIVVATSAREGSPLASGDRLSKARTRKLRDLARTGPWGEHPGSDVGLRAIGDSMLQFGITALAFGPVTRDDDVLGVLVVGTCDRRYSAVVATTMPPLVSFGASANTVLVERLSKRRDEIRLRRSISAILRERTFHPVFQPIVDLQLGTVIGYEALTRFDSGQRPDLCFADAWSVGLGAHLERATIKAAVVASRDLPSGRWLDINVSPRLLDRTGRLAELLRDVGRPIVIEITEHEVIDDYVAIRAAAAALGGDVRLAVDDAGVGIANFGHIIELRPDFVKLDLSLVRRVNADPGRQALVVAMNHFARTAGCRLVAEGVEGSDEADTLRELGVEFAQGHWFGYPEPAGLLSVRSPGIPSAGPDATDTLD